MATTTPVTTFSITGTPKSGASKKGGSTRDTDPIRVGALARPWSAIRPNQFLRNELRRHLLSQYVPIAPAESSRPAVRAARCLST